MIRLLDFFDDQYIHINYFFYSLSIHYSTENSEHILKPEIEKSISIFHPKFNIILFLLTLNRSPVFCHVVTKVENYVSSVQIDDMRSILPVNFQRVGG